MTKLHGKKSELTKLNSFFVEFDTLAKLIENNTDSKIDFRKIGVIYKSRKLNLSQVMYNTAETKHGGQKGKIIMVDFLFVLFCFVFLFCKVEGGQRVVRGKIE